MDNSSHNIPPYPYSPREAEIFTQLGWGDLLSSRSITPPDLYRTAAITCFLQKNASPEAEAVRVGLDAFNHRRVYRGTLEWDKMLQDALERGW